MSLNKCLLAAAVCLLPFKLLAGGGLPERYCFDNENRSWSTTASLGYSHFQQAYNKDGEVILGRLGIGYQLFAVDQLLLGLELGAQNGNNMRFNVSNDILDNFGGLPLDSTIKPMLDALFTIKTNGFHRSAVFVQLKGGVVYRQLQFANRDSIHDLSQVAPELQVGFGYQINKKSSVHLSYQGIYSKNDRVEISSDGQTMLLSNIPPQHGVLLGISYIL